MVNYPYRTLRLEQKVQLCHLSRRNVCKTQFVFRCIYKGYNRVNLEEKGIVSGRGFPKLPWYKDVACMS